MSFIKNILLLLILSCKFIIVLLYDKEFPFYDEAQRKIIDKACNEKDNIICFLASAIEDIFTSIQNDELSQKNGNYYNSLSLQYNNVYSRDILCKNIDIISSLSNNSLVKDEANDIIIFYNCSVLIEGNISYKTEYNSADFGTFLSEIKFEFLSFQYLKGKKSIFFKAKNDTKIYNYNENAPFFASEAGVMKMQMNSLMERISNTYYEKINDKTFEDYSDLLSSTLNNFNKNFSYIQGPKLFDKEKNVTYLYYKELKYDKYIHIKEKIFFPSMNISFEYALNHNITFNEGYFIMKNFIFQENVDLENIYENYEIEAIEKKADFDKDYPEYSKNIWRTIIDDFKNKFNVYRTS
jgi:hypothetical protein